MCKILLQEVRMWQDYLEYYDRVGIWHVGGGGSLIAMISKKDTQTHTEKARVLPENIVIIG